MSESAYRSIRTGFNDLDSIFELGGIEPGSIVLLKSVPNSNAFNFLLSVTQENLEKTEFVTSAHSPRKITDSLEILGCVRSEIPEPHTITPNSGCEDLCETIAEFDLEEQSVVIVDNIEMFNNSTTECISETLQLIREITEQTDSIFILHDLNSSTTGLSDYLTVEYTSDYLFSITKELTDEGIFQNIWIERLPIGQSIKESKKSTRIVKVDDTLKRISTNAGGRI